jgi:hypothetical protein
MKLAARSLLLVGLTGCVARLDTAPPECEVTTDCNHGAGEICEEGRCWGDPPPGPFAIAIGVPAERFYDLAFTELSGVEIAADGWIPNLVVNNASFLEGRIEGRCDGCREGAGIAATVTVKRASTIPGGAELIRTTTIDGDDGTYPESFAIPLPPILSADEPPYQVTIEPATTGELFPGGPPPAAVLPPLRLVFGLGTLDGPQTIVVDASDVQVVTGTIVNSVGQGIGGMRVEARARLDLDTDKPLDRVSTIATTEPDGDFTLLVAGDDVGVVDVIASPPAGVIAPTLIGHDRFIGGGDELVLQMPSYPAATQITLPVVASDGAGNPVGVASARVQLTTTIGDPSGTEAVFTVIGMTDARGDFSAEVLAGSTTAARHYDARVYPGGESQYASRTDVDVQVGAQGGVLATVELARRSSLTGIVLDAQGQPVEGVRIEAEPAIDYLWTLDADAQVLWKERPVAFTQTQPDGAFTLWVDPGSEFLAARYDLVMVPPDFALVPRFTVRGVSGGEDIELETIVAPDGADVRGQVTDLAFLEVPAAEVTIYAAADDYGACIAPNAPEDCQPPATRLAVGQADDDGIVRLVLPR